jgi:hypothetical protein
MSTYKNVNGDFILSTINVNDQIIATAANIVLNGTVGINGNLTADYYFGDGQFLSNVVANIGAASKLQNGTSNVDIPVPSGNITFGVSGVGNLIVISTQTANISANTASINKFTGAVVVGGGLGVNGNVFGGALFDNSQAVLNVVSVIDGGTY